MRSFILFILFILPLFFASFLHAQTNVDRVTARLDSASSGLITGWRYSTDFSHDPTGDLFDDASWSPLGMHQRLSIDSCWIRAVYVVPQSILGLPVEGSLRLVLEVDDLGFLFVNGRDKGKFLWNGEFVIDESAAPGKKYVLAIKALNTGGPLRLLNARATFDRAEEISRRILDLSLSLKTGQKLLSFDTYQTNARVRVDPGIDKSKMDREEKKRLGNILQSAADRIDIAALVREDIRAFDASVDAVRAELAPVAAYAKRFTLYFDANAHIDAAWLWREKETIAVCRNTFASVCNMMQARPDFTYTQSSALYYAWMEKWYPAIFAQIRDLVKQGRWEITGGMWVEPDCNIPGGESWSRHLLYAKNYFREKFGVDVTIGWNPDSFGYNANMPQFYREAGIDAFITQKIGWNDTNVFPYRLFWWESPDGSRILSYFPFDYVNSVSDPYRLIDWLRQFEANTGMTKMMVLFGVGDHGGGPSLEMLRRIDRLDSLFIFPRIEHGHTRDYLSWLRARIGDDLPVWDDELYLEYHRGTFTTQADMKESNRREETLLTNAEKFSAIARSLGGGDHRNLLAGAWKDFLFTQFHDILPGSSIREVYIDARETHDRVRETGRYVLSRSLATIADKIGTAAIRNGQPLVVFNPLAWDRTDIVTYALPEGDESPYSVFTPEGKEVPSQMETVSPLRRNILFLAADVPSLGYRTFVLRPAQSTLPADGRAGIKGIENAHFRVRIDSATGWIARIFDKRLEKELLAGAGNELQMLDDQPANWDAWNVGWTGTVFPTKYRSAEVVERGPVRTVLRLRRDFLRPGVKKEYPTEDFPSTFFTQDVILYKDIPRIDFRTEVDWWEDRIMLKTAFPLACSDTVATYEIPYGTICRSTRKDNNWDKAKIEVPAQRWADLSGKEFGVSLLNRSKYGYDIKGNLLRLSLLRSPKWPDPTADRGKHVIEYALYPHAGDWKQGNTVRAGYDYNNSLIAVATDRHRGSLPLTEAFLKVEPENVVLTCLKTAENSDAWMLQLYETQGKAADVRITVDGKVTRANAADTMEREGVSIPSQNGKIVFPLAARKMASVSVGIAIR